MNVTSKGRYALRIMLDLAQNGSGGSVSLKTISTRQGISMKYLEMIIVGLKKAGLVNSLRGKDGGYVLNRPAENYSVGEILRSVEDSLAPVSCIKGGAITCEHAGECLIVPMWAQLDKLMNNYLDTVSLADLLSGEKWKKNI